MRRSLFYQTDDTITLKIEESQNNINHLLSQLDGVDSVGQKEFGYVQANISDLMGTFHDSQNVLQGDLMDVLESFNKGTMTSDEIQSLLINEKERGNISLKLVEDIQLQMDEVLSFVAHFISDVESGKPLPKNSFQSLFQELDGMSDSVHAMSKVVRTPSRRVREVKASIQTQVEHRHEKSRGIGAPPIMTFLNQQHRRHGSPSDTSRQDREFFKESARGRESARGDPMASRSDSRPDSRGGGAGSPNTRPQLRKVSSFRALSEARKENGQKDGDDDKEDLGLHGKKPSYAVKGIQRQRSGNITVKSSLVRSLTREMSDDEISMDSSADAGTNKWRRSKPKGAHRQTQTDEEITLVRSGTTPQKETSATMSKNVMGKLSAAGSFSPSKKSMISTHENGSGSHQGGSDIHGKSQSGVSKQSTVVVKQKTQATGRSSQLTAPGGVVKSSTNRGTRNQGSSRPSSRPNSRPVSPRAMEGSSSIPSITGGGVTSSVGSTNSVGLSSVGSVVGSGTTTQGGISRQSGLSKNLAKEVIGKLEELSFDEAEDEKEKLELERLKQDADGMAKYLELKEKRLEKLESRLQSKQENLDIIIEGRVNMRVQELRLKVNNGESESDNSKKDSSSSAGGNASTTTAPKHTTDSKDGKKKGKSSTGQKKHHPSTGVHTSDAPVVSSLANTALSEPSVPSGSSDSGPSSVPAAAAAVGTIDLNTIVKTIIQYLPGGSGPQSSQQVLALPQQEGSATSMGREGSAADGGTGMRRLVSTGTGPSRPPSTESNRPTSQSSWPSSSHHPGATEKDIPEGSTEDEGGGIKLPLIPQPGGKSSAALGSSRHQLSNSSVGMDPRADEALMHSKPSPASKGRPASRDQENKVRRESRTPSRVDAGVDSGERPESKRSRKDSKIITGSNYSHHSMTDDDDAIAVNLSNYCTSHSLNPSRSNTGEPRGVHASAPDVNQIWVPPPTKLSSRKLPSTIMIFPLHSVDQSTSTDDLPGEPATRPEVETTPVPTSSVDAPIDVREDRITITRDGGKSTTLDKLQSELINSPNPLALLYKHFFPYLSVLSRHHLMAAASGTCSDMSKPLDVTAPASKAGPTYSTAGLAELFEIVTEEVSKLEYTSYYAYEAMDDCEETVHSLIIIAESGQRIDKDFFAALKAASKQIGEIEMAEAWVDMLLTNSRTIFNRIRALGINPSSVGQKFSDAYKAFLNCQGRNIALKKRLRALKKKVNLHLQQPIASMKEEDNAPNGALLHKLNTLAARCEQLEEDLGDAQDEVEELRAQCILMDRELDRTPGALFFFSALHNPKLPEIVSKHIQQLGSIKGVIDGKEHFDFMTLKHRLEAIFLGLPALSQFFKRYTGLQKKWSQTRAKLFLDKKLIGGDADKYFICPMCNVDSRQITRDALGGSAGRNIINSPRGKRSRVGTAHSRSGPLTSLSVREGSGSREAFSRS
mmetsp:Transcript_15807/g.23779  ORF Transcript_15807/g.23779 Transcript_15807/m.23779 type:complete len:1445 (-) Transcript_15807:140-4474(-)|eukprot:CAMPEP_0185036548 /NCGR_PEP_ID=MMETSP1103-20130426/29670_1 /TAXON_ID=36769 /ORGANISM="Paraphysomonas bandaiensis, Strain Caron Lab Isolate" /LENGTH=1444 /DNA_ID=CAMNT_0027574115 /DNA_START=75 /DNA_END=4409 /DNA_ORIENTATION=+